MIKKITSLLMQDGIIAIRDKVFLYMLIFPIMVSVFIQFIAPKTEPITLHFVCNKQIDGHFAKKLKEYGIVELKISNEQLYSRVNQSDQAIGIIKHQNNFKIVLEGNEPPLLVKQADAVINHINNPHGKYSISLENNGYIPQSTQKNIIVILCIFALLIGSRIAAYNMAIDNETNTIHCIIVSPVRAIEYLTAKTLIALFINMCLVVIITLVFQGFLFAYHKLLLAIVCTSFLAAIIAFTVGCFAKNQMQAMQYLKLFFVLFLSVPIMTIFIPENIQWLLYLFPNYWVFKVFENIFYQEHINYLLLYCGICVIYTIVLYMLLTGIIKKQLKLLK